MPNKSIAILSTGLTYGGAETLVVQLALQLKSRGWDVKVISMRAPLAYVDKLSSQDIPVHTLEMKAGVPDIRAVFKLASLLRRWKPLILHSHMVHANLLARITRLFYWVPLQISTAHSLNEGGRWRELAYRLTDPLCNITTNVSQAAVERYIQVGAVPKDKICLMPNGVDTTKFRPSLKARDLIRRELDLGENFVWLSVGRFEAVKDHAAQIKAFAELSQEGRKSLLLLVGQGSLETEIKNLVTSLQLDEKIRFLGVRKDITKIMNAADAYLMSSLWEGMPMVLLEAAAVGLPIVATNVGGNPEVVRDNENGFLVEKQNPQSLGSAMQRIMQCDKQGLQEMGGNGRTYIEQNYSMERITDRWERLYQQLWQEIEAKLK